MLTNKKSILIHYYCNKLYDPIFYKTRQVLTLNKNEKKIESFNIVKNLAFSYNHS